jgi:hypothetical protein
MYEHGLQVLGILEMIDKYNLLDVIEEPSEEYILELTRFEEPEEE